MEWQMTTDRALATLALCAIAAIVCIGYAIRSTGYTPDPERAAMRRMLHDTDREVTNLRLTMDRLERRARNNGAQR